MYAATLAKLGLSPTASDAELASALANPSPGRPAQAWNTEVQERMKDRGENYQTAWAACQDLSDPLWQSYLRDCSKRNGQAVQAEADREAAVIREGKSFDAEEHCVPDASGRRTGNGKTIATANAALAALSPEKRAAWEDMIKDTTPIEAAAIKYMIEGWLKKQGITF